MRDSVDELHDIDLAAIRDSVKRRFRDMVITLSKYPSDDVAELILKFAVYKETIEVLSDDDVLPGINALDAYIYDFCRIIPAEETEPPY